MTPAKRPRGRPAKPDAERLVRVSFRLRPDEVQKLALLGGRDWLSQKLRKATMPKQETEIPS